MSRGGRRFFKALCDFEAALEGFDRPCGVLRPPCGTLTGPAEF